MEYKYKTTKLTNLFYKHDQSFTYLIPHYQREFCWEESNLNIFFFQLKNSLEKADNSYFFRFYSFSKFRKEQI